MIIDLPSLTTPTPKENLYIYLVAKQEALELLALSLLHVSRRLRRYFEAHLIKVNTDQPIKQILSIAQASGKLVKYSIELGAYEIMYEPQNAIKAQVLENFLNEISIGSNTVTTKQVLQLVDEQADSQDAWILYTYGAPNTKGSKAGLVLISPAKMEYTYPLRLNFDNINNEAEYEALLAVLRISKKMKVQSLSTRVDSKLVASLINDDFIACKGSMIKYLAKAKEHIAYFKKFKIRNIPQNQN
ncbi:reverse transcriptase domain-containing protein [Tanacetum coccineum]|uniref:Reverse transcriptase domain-containing protein n=1 Tax=Tanacetum coccineum TaxID=301880 RepID=A0ABQ4ZKC8_9ASTR